ncbi:hypothetical protein LY78DRAFT_35985 [Colletotrichum sublineola]|nr:hypothetical protein LY78DRAFT_35985 [Colletotrichum sublineola]
MCDDCRLRTATQRLQNNRLILSAASLTENLPVVTHHRRSRSISPRIRHIPDSDAIALPPPPPTEATMFSNIPSSMSHTSEHDYWWLRLRRLRVRPFHQAWTGSCTFCSAVLLSTEKPGWCCVNGSRMASKLPPYTPHFQS